jgi:DNA sulfur modification protein DndD
MEIKILGWGYENIRRFNTLDLDLLQGGTHLSHVTLVMMRNGTGKTTTISLMRSVLNGTATNWNPEEVRSYKPTKGQASQGKFYIKIKFGTELYHYNLILDYERGRASYETSHVGMSGGLEQGHTLPMQLKGVFTKEFINRFIFDGEQAKKTLSADSKEAELAVTYLYQIEKLDNLISEINSLVQRKQSESDSKGATSSSLSYNRTRMENKRNHYLNLVTRRDKVILQMSQYQTRWVDLENQRTELITSDERLRQDQLNLTSRKALKNNELNSLLQTIGTEVKEPFNIHSLFDARLKSLMNNMQTLKLPKTTAREFFKELSESPECVCGRPIGQEEKVAILKRADNYLGEDDLSVINAIKDSLRNYSTSGELTIALEQMITLKEEIQSIQSALDRLVLHLDEEAIRKAESIAEEQSDIKQKILGLQQERDILDAPYGTPNTSEQNNVAAAEKAWKEAEENLQRATGTYEYTQKANKLIIYINNIRSLALQKLKDSIIIKTNEKVERILTDDRITVDKIDGSLILHDRTAVSEGQTLAIAYSYIGSLFEHSSFEFPFVIDSPAASMDLGVRREVASIIPTLFKQLIIFVTSGEVAGFAEKFYSMDDVLYATIEGKENNEKATCTFGKDYFSAYQCEEEE